MIVTVTYKTALGLFFQHFRFNYVYTAKAENPTLLSRCFFENLSRSGLKVGVLFTLFLLSNTEGHSGVDTQ